MKVKELLSLNENMGKECTISLTNGTILNSCIHLSTLENEGNKTILVITNEGKITKICAADITDIKYIDITPIKKENPNFDEQAQREEEVKNAIKAFVNKYSTTPTKVEFPERWEFKTKGVNITEIVELKQYGKIWTFRAVATINKCDAASRISTKDKYDMIGHAQVSWFSNQADNEVKELPEIHHVIVTDITEHKPVKE